MSADTLTRVGTIPDRAVGLVAHAAGDVRVEPVPVRAPRPEEAVVDILRWCQDRTTTQAFRAECEPCGRRPP
jgi:hypothetical protein